MQDSQEVYRAAVLLIDKYGDMAVNGAFIKADDLRNKGDVEGHALWTRVAKVAEDLLSETVPDDQAIN